ncbi:hypothetical protein QVD17_09100 [Tagetes erecta]|uniref:Uncharacterized protein n=1 Tax=Tagetes erecta TaxID=13708 RepID=A0AAD8L3M8_TARER|nr:hypothetical protein QVD17_09100 [Tagetes erecta]
MCPRPNFFYSSPLPYVPQFQETGDDVARFLNVAEWPFDLNTEATELNKDSQAPGPSQHTQATSQFLYPRARFQLRSVNESGQPEDFGYGFTPINLWFYFKTPDGDLDTGLLPLRNSEDVTILTSYIGVNGLREIELHVVIEELNEDTGKDVKSGTRRPHVREDAPVCRRLF